MILQIAGGIYREWCEEGPNQEPWDELFGSGLRAASILTKSGPLLLHGFIGIADQEAAAILAETRGVPVHLIDVPRTITFSYPHALATPMISPALRSISPAPSLNVEGAVVLRFGMLEGAA